MKVDRIGLETYNGCNINCKMCSGKPMSRKVEFLPTAVCEKIIDDIVANDIETLMLTGAGEPLIDVRTPDFVRYAKRRGVRIVTLTTNATLLDEKMSRKLIEAGLDALFISITGAGQEVYSEWQGCSQRALAVVEKNVAEFIKLREESQNRTSVNIRYLWDNQSNADCAAYFKKWYPLADWVTFGFCYPVEINGYVPDFNNNLHGTISCFASKWLTSSALYITSSGETTICAWDFPTECLTMGNSKDTALEEFVHKYHDHERQIKHIHDAEKLEEFPLICKECAGRIEGYDNLGELDIVQALAARSLMQNVLSHPGSIVLVGANVVSQFMLLNKEFADKVIAVVDSEKTGFIKGKEIKGIDFLTDLDHTLLVFSGKEYSHLHDMYDGVFLEKFITKVNDDYFCFPQLRQMYVDFSDIDMSTSLIYKYTRANLLEKVLCSDKNIIMFGANAIAEMLLRDPYLYNKTIAIVDSYKEGDFCGKQIVDAEYLHNVTDVIVIITSVVSSNEIYQVIESKGLNERLEIWKIVDEFSASRKKYACSVCTG